MEPLGGRPYSCSWCRIRPRTNWIFRRRDCKFRAFSRSATPNLLGEYRSEWAVIFGIQAGRRSSNLFGGSGSISLVGRRKHTRETARQASRSRFCLSSGAWVPAGGGGAAWGGKQPASAAWLGLRPNTSPLDKARPSPRSREGKTQGTGRQGRAISRRAVSSKGVSGAVS